MVQVSITRQGSYKKGDIVCLSDPFPSTSYADLKTFSENALGPGESVVVDCEYMGDVCICVSSDTHNK